MEKIYKTRVKIEKSSMKNRNNFIYLKYINFIYFKFRIY